MIEIYENIKGNLLFEDINYSDFVKISDCLECKVQKFNKGEIIFLAGNKINSVCIVISGNVLITKEDINGNLIIITEIHPGDMFGETFACAGVSHSPVNAIANENSEIFTFNYNKIFSVCTNACSLYNRLIANMLKIMAVKNMFLNKKINILSKKTIREKLFCFFDYVGNGEKKFTVDLSREEMAAYIATDRSAMCAELSRMQKDGLLKYNKKRFEITDKADISK